MYISAIILSYNAGRSINRCLSELIEALEPFGKDNEIFVVDNGSGDQSVSIIETFHQRYPQIVKPIYLKTNTGTTFSRNSALTKADGDFVLILDSDAYIGFAALSQLVDYLQAHPATGIVAPRLYYRSGSFQLSCDSFPTLLRKVRRFLFLKRWESAPIALKAATQPIDVDYAISACWLLRRDAVEETGLFDEKIFYSPEDVDYCLRVWRNGLKVTYLPAAEVIHDAQELSRGFRLSSFHFQHLKGLLYLFRKHRYFWRLGPLYRRIGRFIQRDAAS